LTSENLKSHVWNILCVLNTNMTNFKFTKNNPYLTRSIYLIFSFSLLLWKILNAV
jgi:hypothetical protein